MTKISKLYFIILKKNTRTHKRCHVSEKSCWLPNVAKYLNNIHLSNIYLPRTHKRTRVSWESCSLRDDTTPHCPAKPRNSRGVSFEGISGVGGFRWFPPFPSPPLSLSRSCYLVSYYCNLYYYIIINSSNLLKSFQYLLTFV